MATLRLQRLLVTNDYLTALNESHVHLVTNPIERITERGVVTKDGHLHECDAIVMATGFHVTSFLSTIRIQDRNGELLNDRWSNPDNVEAYYGTMLSGCPNLFILLGPNTALGHTSVIIMIEAQIEYMIKVLREMFDRGAQVVDADKSAQDAYNKWVHSNLTTTVWAGSCMSWYKTASGKIVTLWPHSTVTFWWTLLWPKFSEMKFSSRPPASVPAALTNNA